MKLLNIFYRQWSLWILVSMITQTLIIIFEIHTKKLREKGVLADDVELHELARRTKNYSGAEIEGIVMAALSNAQIETFDPKKGMAIRTEDLSSFRINRSHFMYSLEHDVKAFFGRHESELQEFVERPLIVWGPPMAELLEQAACLIGSLRDDGEHGCGVNKMTLLLHGASHIGKGALAMHLAQLTGFTFIRMCSIRYMIGFTESARCVAFKKVFDDALKAPMSVVILDDLEHIIDYSSIGPCFSIGLVKHLIGMIACFVPKGKRMLIIAPTEHLVAMKELGLYSALGKNALAVPRLRQASEVLAVLGDLDNLFAEPELRHIEADLVAAAAAASNGDAKSK